MQLTKDATAVDKANPVAIAIDRAVGYLSNAIANPPDAQALRALLVAGGKGHPAGTPLDPAIAQLKQPSQWPKDDHVAMAAALAAAERYGKAEPADLEAAAKLLVAEQHQDGSYGSMLDSWLARTSLIASGIQPDNFTVVQIDKWVRGAAPESLLDAISATLALELASDVMAEGLRRTSLGIIRQHQRESGAFGAADDPSPIFETALAVLALAMLDTEPRLARSTYRAEELKDAIAGGKRFLAAHQRQDGSWPGSIAVNGWSLLALLSGA